MCKYWYSQALLFLGVTCPSKQTETQDFLEEVKNTLNINPTCSIHLLVIP